MSISAVRQLSMALVLPFLLTSGCGGGRGSSSESTPFYSRDALLPSPSPTYTSPRNQDPTSPPKVYSEADALRDVTSANNWTFMPSIEKATGFGSGYYYSDDYCVAWSFQYPEYKVFSFFDFELTFPMSKTSPESKSYLYTCGSDGPFDLVAYRKSDRKQFNLAHAERLSQRRPSTVPSSSPSPASSSSSTLVTLLWNSDHSTLNHCSGGATLTPCTYSRSLNDSQISRLLSDSSFARCIWTPGTGHLTVDCTQMCADSILQEEDRNSGCMGRTYHVRSCPNLTGASELGGSCTWNVY